jgi:hypothetical protein
VLPVLPADVCAYLELATLEVLPGSFVDEALPIQASHRASRRAAAV